MQNGFRQKRTWLFWLLIVQLLNMSVDPPDRLMYANAAAESRSNFNEIESLAELIIESQEGWEEAIPENNDAESETHQVSPFPLFLSGTHAFLWPMPGLDDLFCRHDQARLSPERELFTPPPEA